MSTVRTSPADRHGLSCEEACPFTHAAQCRRSRQPFSRPSSTGLRFAPSYQSRTVQVAARQGRHQVTDADRIGQMLCNLGVMIQGQSLGAARTSSNSRKAMKDFGDVALHLALSRKSLQSSNREKLNTKRLLHLLLREESALRMQLQQLEAESTTCNWLLKDARAVHAKIYSTDSNSDKVELVQTRRAVAKQGKRWRSLISDAVRNADFLDGELTEQIKGIMLVTTEWKEMKKLVSAAAEVLEQCRVRRVQAEQDHRDHFKFGSAGADTQPANASTGDPADETKKQATAARIPRYSVLCCGKKYLDEVPLLLDADAETQLLETLPPLKLLMTLQGYSLAFNQLGKAVCSLSAWINIISQVQLLNSSQAMEMLSMAGRDVLRSDHVVVYCHMGEQYWAVAPTARSGDTGGGSTPVPRQVGRGMVGYAAMVRKDVRVADAKASPLYDARAEDIAVAPLAHSVHPTAVARAQHDPQAGDTVLVKAMRGWRAHSGPFIQDDMAVLRVIANTAQQAIIHQEDMCIAERKTTLAKFMVDVRRSIGSELQLERAMDLAADVLAEAVDSDVGLVHLLRPDRRNPSFQTYSSLSGARLGVRPWQISLLMHCCTTKEAVLCNDPGRDSRYSPAVDGALTGVKVHNTLLVPWMSSSGSCIGVLQVQNRKHWPATSLRPFERCSHYTERDANILADLAGMLEDARTHCESLLALRDRHNPLSHVPFSEHVDDAHTKIQYMLKDALGVLHARILEVDHANQQLIASGENSISYYPLSAASIAATVVNTGELRHLQNPAVALDFNRHIDVNAGVGVVEDLLVVPVTAAIGSPAFRSNTGMGPCSLDQLSLDTVVTPKARVIAIVQVSSKRRGLLGANDIQLAEKLATQISFMLQRVHQLCKGKRAAAQMTSVICTMQQLSMAQHDPHRRQAVMNDLARNVLDAEMVQLAPVKAVRTSEGWDCVPPNAKARTLTDEVVRLVEDSQVLFDETRGCLSEQDAFFGTTIKPERLLGCPVWLQPGAMYAVLVVQRFSIEPYSKLEIQIVDSVARRIGLLASQHAL